LHHRPTGSGPGPAGGPPSRPRPRRGPHPLRQGHRAAQLPLPPVRRQSGVAGAGARRPRSAHLLPAALPGGRGSALGAEAAAPPALPRRWARRPQRSAGDPTPATLLALDGSALRRLSPTPFPPRHRLSRSLGNHHPPATWLLHAIRLRPSAHLTPTSTNNLILRLAILATQGHHPGGGGDPLLGARLRNPISPTGQPLTERSRLANQTGVPGVVREDLGAHG